jgi:hypothetical protein
MQAVNHARLAAASRAGRRLRPAVAAVVAAAAALLLLAAPASAASGPPVVGCTTGSSCTIELNYLVTYSGSSGGHNGVVIPPPPCIGVPAGDAHTGSDAIISLYGNTAPVPDPSTVPPSTVPPSTVPPSAGASSPASPTATSTASLTALIATPTASPAAPAATGPDLNAQQQQILDQARQLAKGNPITPGEWYQISGDPYASAAAQQECGSLPPYVWVAGGGRLPKLHGLNIPPETLARLAYSQLTTAQLGKVTLNPGGASDTNLPTFLDVALRPPARGVLSVTAGGDPYVWATATTPDGESATVWAWATGLTISPGTPSATTYADSRCSVAHLSANGHTFMLGSRYSKAEMAQVGTGSPIDCGVTYTAPGTFRLTANVTWNACWAKGTATAGGPPPGCQRVPGAAGLAASTTAPVPVAVREIQSVNNG